MTPSKACFDIIKLYEQGPTGGPALKAYKCPAGVWTIGYGHTKGVKEGDTCDEHQANLWLMGDTREAVTDVHARVDAAINQNQFDALVSFVFNIGGTKFAGSTLLRKLNDGDYKGAADEFPRWNKSKGKVLNGLTMRRADERELFLTPWE